MEEEKTDFDFTVFHLLETKINIEEILVLKGLENKWDKIAQKAQEKRFL